MNNGHNSALTPDEKKALIFHRFREIRAQQAVVDAARQDLKDLRGRARADGIVLADIDFMMRCAAVEDPAIIPAELGRRIELAAMMALPVRYEPDLFNAAPPPLEQAEALGEVAGLKSDDNDPPYERGTPDAAAWTKGWKRGQKHLSKSLTPALEKAQNMDDGADAGGNAK